MKKIALLSVLFLLAYTSVAQTASCSCCTEEHSEFDFWLGNWEVKLPDGTLAGENRIEKTEGGCVIRENWKGANAGFTGTSYNYFNPESGLWEQLWLDSSGTILKLSGGRVGNQMVLRSEESLDDNQVLTFQQITWTLLSDGKVRQVWEVLRDGASTRVLFDGLYTRKQ